MAARRGNGRKAKAPAAVASGFGAQPATSTQQTARQLAPPAEAPSAPQQRPTALQTAASKVQQVAAAAASPVVGLAKKLTPKKPAAAPGGDAVVPTRLFPVDEDSEQEGDPDDDTAPAAMADQLLSFDAPQQRSSSTTPSPGNSTPRPRSKQQPGSSEEAATAEEGPDGEPAAEGFDDGPCAESATQRMCSWAAGGMQRAAAAMGQGLQRLRSSCSQVTVGHLMGVTGCLLALLCILLLTMASSTSRLHQQQASKLAEQQTAALQQQEVLAAMQKSLLQVQQQLAQLPVLQQQLQDTSTNYSSSAAGLHHQQQQLVAELQQLQAQVAGVAAATAAPPTPAATTNSTLLDDPEALQTLVSEVVTQQAKAKPRNLATPACGAFVANHTQLAGSHGTALRLGMLAQRVIGRLEPHLHPAATVLLLGGGPLQPQAQPRCLRLVASPHPGATVTPGTAGDVEGHAAAAPNPAQVVIQLPGPANISKVVLLLMAPSHARPAAQAVHNSSSTGEEEALAGDKLSGVMPVASAVEVGVHHVPFGAVQPVATAQWPAPAPAAAAAAASAAAAMSSSNGPAGSQLHTLELTIAGDAVGDAVNVRLWSAAAAGPDGEGGAGDSAAPAMVCLHRVLVLGRPVAAAAHQFMC